MAKKPLTICLDLELSPNLAHVWGAYEQNVIGDFVKEFELLSFAYQVKGQKTVHVKGRCDYKDDTDQSLTNDLWEVFDKADIIIGHNIDKFDVRKANARFLYWRLEPPSNYRTIDTLKIHRKVVMDNKNGLDYICQKHGLGRKTDAKYSDLWLRCLQNDKKAWQLMKKYNAEDVKINMKLYDLLLPWISNHPNMATIANEFCCTNCTSADIIKDGFGYNQGTKFQKLRCKDCGANPRATIKKDGTLGKLYTK